MPMLPYRVLESYKPSKWRSSLIGRHLTDLTRDLGFRPHVDVAHGPLKLTGRNWCSPALHAEVRRRTFKTTQAEGWHFDADLEPSGDPNCLICLWASNTPTQIKWRNRSGVPQDREFEIIYQPRPYEVVVFNNMECLHRRPPNAPRVRWVFRQRLAPRS